MPSRNFVLVCTYSQDFAFPLDFSCQLEFHLGVENLMLKLYIDGKSKMALNRIPSGIHNLEANTQHFQLNHDDSYKLKATY